MALAVRLAGADGGGTAVVDSLNQLKLPTTPLEPAVSITRRSTCSPAVIWMLPAVIVVHFCAPPVGGTLSAPVTLTPSTSRWNLPAVVCALATRKSML